MQDDSEKVRHLADLNRQYAIAAHERSYQSIADARKAALDAATTTVRLLILINGGAVVALLAFAGALETGGSGSTVTLGSLAMSIRGFALGVGLSACAAACVYFVSMVDAEILSSVRHIWEHPYILEEKGAKRRLVVRAIFYWIGLALALGSLAAFFIGVYQVTEAITGLGL